MTDDLLYTTSGACIFKAGIDHEPISEVTMNALGIMAEGDIHSQMRIDLSGANLTESTRGILTEIESSLIAIPMIKAAMRNYTSRAEAESMITVERDTALRNMQLIKDKKVTDFIQNDT